MVRTLMANTGLAEPDSVRKVMASTVAAIDGTRYAVDAMGQLGAATEFHSQRLESVYANKDKIISAMTDIGGTITKLNQQPSVNIKSSADIQQATRVFVEGHVTADDTTTHALLNKVVGLLATIAGGNAPSAVPISAPRPASQDTMNLVRGY